MTLILVAYIGLYTHVPYVVHATSFNTDACELNRVISIGLLYFFESNKSILAKTGEKLLLDPRSTLAIKKAGMLCAIKSGDPMTILRCMRAVSKDIALSKCLVFYLIKLMRHPDLYLVYGMLFDASGFTYYLAYVSDGGRDFSSLLLLRMMALCLIDNCNIVNAISASKPYYFIDIYVSILATLSRDVDKSIAGADLLFNRLNIKYNSYIAIASVAILDGLAKRCGSTQQYIDIISLLNKYNIDICGTSLNHYLPSMLASCNITLQSQIILYYTNFPVASREQYEQLIKARIHVDKTCANAYESMLKNVSAIQ